MEELRNLLISNGANLVGFADLKESKIDNELSFGISVAVKLSPELINSIKNRPNIQYYEECHSTNNLLDKIVTIGTEYLIKNGFKAIAQTTTTLNHSDDFTTKLPHKTVATKAGLGWIGKSGLLVTNEYGSGIRLSSFLTNANLDCGKPIEKSSCGNCMECVKNCPANAITGKLWNIDVKRSELIDVNKCNKTAREITMKSINKDITLCGKCFIVCPYTIVHTRVCARVSATEFA